MKPWDRHNAGRLGSGAECPAASGPTKYGRRFRKKVSWPKILRKTGRFSMAAAAKARSSERRAEKLLNDLLASQGWDDRRPPKGNLLLQTEYRDFPDIASALAGASKSGSGYGIPEAILIEPDDGRVLAVIEAKAARSDLSAAISEACQYGDALITGGHSPLAISLAGTDADEFDLRVAKWDGTQWNDVTYEGHPINWIPNQPDLERVVVPGGPAELRPTPPPAEVLADRADEINRLLREADVKDEYRPTAVAAIMLALWHSKGEIRRDPRYILQDVNSSCRDAFTAAGKIDLADGIRINAANEKLRAKAPRIANILERLNVTVLTAEHDYLG